MTTSRLTTRVALFATIAVATALGGTATAQTVQADPDHAVHHPEGAVTAQAAPPAAQPPATPGAGAPGSAPGAGPMGSPGMMMGGRGMMGPGGMMGTPDESGRRRMMMMHHGAGSTPMNVIINVGPGIRVEAEDGGGPGGGRGMGMGPPGGAGMMEPGMMGMMMGPRGGAMGPDALRHFERIDAHLAYVRAVLRVTDAQAPQWNAFADAARAAAERLRQAYAQAIQAAAQPTTAPAQLERRIALLSAQVEAMRAFAASAEPLYAALSGAQKRTADDLLAEHLRDMQRRGL